LKEKNVCVSRKNLCYRVAKSSLFSHCPLDLGVASSPHRPLGEMKRYLARSTSHEGSWPLRAKVIDLHLLIFPTDASRNRWKYDIFRVKVGNVVTCILCWDGGCLETRWWVWIRWFFSWFTYLGWRKGVCSPYKPSINGDFTIFFF